jgi:hypothetical protein
MTTYDLGFYNLQESRPASRTHPEVRALLQHGSVERGPLDVLGLVELVGNTIPTVKGWRRIRSCTTPGRTNVGCYVRSDLYDTHRWEQLTRTWLRPKHPDQGQHPARAILIVRLKDGTQFVVTHFPQDPKGSPRPHELEAARDEFQKALISIMAPWTRDGWKDRTTADQQRARDRTRIVIGDQNATQRKPILLAVSKSAELKWHGRGIDLMGARRAQKLKMEYPTSLAGVTLGSDHKHAGSARVRVSQVLVAGDNGD